MKEIRERIKEVRQTLDYGVCAFAKQLGYTHATVSTVENGKSPVTEKMIVSICAKFHVNEQWLRTGNGEMFVPKEEPQLSREEIITDFIQTILEELSEANRRIVLDAIEKLEQEKFFKKRKG
ncbi:MAG: helix-turn-helix transcriptional regulator [Thermoguttaceae bacterium]|nr:helix-turn-helix transcriptional regulator [Thermoguttaceae bacterium]